MIRVGSSSVASQLKELLPSIDVVLDTAKPHWKRDLAIPLPNGEVLQPHPISERSFDQVAHLASKFRPYLFSRGLPSGHGIFIAIDSSVALTKTSLEGGNVIFWESGGKRGALVGLASIFLSWGSMLDAGDLSQALCEEYIESHSFDVNKIFFEMAEPPLTNGVLLAAQWNRVLDQIAKELQIAREDLIILEHDSLHIDLKVMVLPGKKVLLHSPQKEQEAWERLFQEMPQMKERYGRQLEKTALPRVWKVFSQNYKALQQAGFEVIETSGFYSIEKGKGASFLNSLLLRDPLRKCDLLCAPAMHPEFCELYPLAHYFYEQMQQQGILTVFIEMGKNPSGHHFYGGGIRCITSHPFPMDAIPVAFEALNPMIATTLKIEGMDPPFKFISQGASRLTEKEITVLLPWKQGPIPYHLETLAGEKIGEGQLVAGHPHYLKI